MEWDKVQKGTHKSSKVYCHSGHVVLGSILLDTTSKIQCIGNL